MCSLPDSAAGSSTTLAPIIPLESSRVPLQLLHGAQGGAQDPFARRARLLDIDESGRPVLDTGGDGRKSLAQRFMRVVAERGDFSALSSSKLSATGGAIKAQDAEREDVGDDETAIAPEQVNELQQTLQQQLEAARSELTTGLDLLSVLMPLTDPPTVDVDSLPLPPETLKLELVHKASQSTSGQAQVDAHDARLTLATSLSSTKLVAQSLFRAADPLFDELGAESKRSTAWERVIRLRHTTFYDLLPLGASAGASFSGQPDLVARDLGVFVGCQESREGFRRRAIVRMSDLVDFDDDRKADGLRKRRHRKLVASVVLDGTEEHRAAWTPSRRDDDVSSSTTDRVQTEAREAFAEELFAIMANEARTDDGAKATFEAGSRARGDRIGVEGTGWTLTLTHVEDRQEEEEDAPLARGVLACARLLLTEEYERRRKSPSGWTRPILQTLSVLLSHTYRCRYIWQTLNELDGELWDDDTVAIRCHLFGRTREVGGDPADALVEAVDRVLAHDQDLGGRAAIQVNRRTPFHVTFSQVLPFAPSATANVFAITHQPLMLGSVAVPSLPHLKSFLAEQVKAIVQQEQRR